jgi:hypothetical protein
MNRILFLLVILLSSCNRTAQRKTESVFILRPYPLNKNHISGEPTRLSPYPYYFDHNFIIDTGGAVYYFAREHHEKVRGSDLISDRPPDFINLQPADLVQVPVDGLEFFLQVNVLNQDRPRRLSTISIVKDSIQSKALFTIADIFIKNHVPWLYRKTTQEEDVVLRFKKMQTYYDYTSVHWDSTKIHFFPSTEELLKFTPPVVEK